MVEQRRDKRFRVTGEDEDGDIHAFETDSRERVKQMEMVFRESLKNVLCDRMRMP
jgi:hypothetical protein